MLPADCGAGSDAPAPDSASSKDVPIRARRSVRPGDAAGPPSPDPIGTFRIAAHGASSISESTWAILLSASALDTVALTSAHWREYRIETNGDNRHYSHDLSSPKMEIPDYPVVHCFGDNFCF